MVRLLVVRHGQSVWNALGRWQGQADPPLSAEGESQAREAGAALLGAGISRIFSSDLQRALCTAEIIGEQLGVDSVSADPALREVDVGAWSGLTREQIEHRWPGMLAARAQGRLLTPPGGETLTDLTVRVRRAVNGIAAAMLENGAAYRTAGDAPVSLLVSHRGPISTLERAAGLEPARAGNLAGHWLEVDSGLKLRHLASVNLLSRSTETSAPEIL